MKRKEFLKKIGLGAAVIAVAPLLIIPKEEYPFVSAGTISFNDNLTTDEHAEYAIMQNSDGITFMNTDNQYNYI